jgi:Phosphotransferase enzyme family
MKLRSLTVDTIVPYLVQRQLIDVSVIVDGDLEVIDVGRRNENLKVVSRHGPSYLVKQPGEGELATDATVRCEAYFYAHCAYELETAEMREVMPTLRAWDSDRGVLILDLVQGRSLWAHYAATPAPEFPSDAAAPLGRALGTVHRVFRGYSSGRGGWLARLPATPPWILFAHRPTPEMLARLSPANLEVLKLLQRNRPMAAGMDELRTTWQGETLIHNDIKGDNVLVTGAAGEGPPGVRIVDWELIQIGDPAWDVGTVFRDFLDYWLLSVPLSGDLTPEQMLSGAALPLRSLHPAARAFWQAYRAAASLDVEHSGALLRRALRFAAARMAQGAYELSMGAESPSNLAVAMLQLAANIMDDPSEASLHLFGVPVGWRKLSSGPRDG